jgi:hypothetical protein
MTLPGPFSEKISICPPPTSQTHNTQIIHSTDTDVTLVNVLKQIAALPGALDDLPLILDISECHSSDLFFKHDSKLLHDPLKFEFTQVKCDILKALENNKTVILKGRFSEELMNDLAPYLLEQEKIQANLVNAQNILNNVKISLDFQLKISQICSELEIEGLRGDIVSTRAAKALCAFENRTEVTISDIKRTISLCLRHRLRRDPMESINSGDKIA